MAAIAYLEVRCKAGAVDRLIEQLRELPWVFSIEHVVGDFDLFLSVCAADLPSLGRQVNQLGVLKGVRSSRTLLSLRHYREGSRWQVRALPAGCAAPARWAPSTCCSPSACRNSASRAAP
ncbi:Lrp/AsnC family transcriptional regulator [Streptomyces cinerochromogenes]|uniref:Lrp/AsnC family transcriptional regulator n=1 Tax=Streptomyces cinerochromogenes TaxID=66422 RepID=A0ABW7BD96_9ACTN